MIVDFGDKFFQAFVVVIYATAYIAYYLESVSSDVTYMTSHFLFIFAPSSILNSNLLPTFLSLGHLKILSVGHTNNIAAVLL